MFEWDEDKAHANKTKHGITFETAKLAFLDPCRIIMEDAEHSFEEERHYCIGDTGAGIATVCFALREETIQIVSAGYWKKEKGIYDKTSNIH
jgi:uncharacterized DUF497 family protein